MSTLNLAQPLWLLGLLALVPLAMAWGHAYVRHRRADAAYGGAPGLRRGRSRPRAALRWSLLVTAIVLAALTMARPRWGTSTSPVQRRGIDIAIALDISRSMQATDVEPSRATAAAAGLRAMLLHLDGDRVGLITFGGSAFARSPLTLDLDAMSDLVTRAQKEGTLVQPGTDIGAAIKAALQLLDVPDRAHTQAIVLISDGEDLGKQATDAVLAAKAKGIRIYTVAAGTEQGAPVPAGEGARPGAADVISRAERAALGRIASESGGTTRDVTTIAGLAVDFARFQQTALDADNQRVPIERFQWVLALALALLLVQTLIADASGTASSPGRRRPNRGAMVTALLALAVVASACGGTAAYRAVQAGNQAFTQGQFQQALVAYNNARKLTTDDAIVQYNIGNTLHRLERYEEATTASKSAVTATKDSVVYARATYALGNNAFRRNALTEARDAYVTVLQRDPNDGDARHNLEVVLRALRPAPPAQNPDAAPPGSPQQPNAGGTPSANNGAGGPPTPQGTTPGANAGSPQNGQPGTGASNNAAQSEAEARAQLLQALQGLQGDVTPEEALRVLDAARSASEQGTLGRPQNPGPNDR